MQVYYIVNPKQNLVLDVNFCWKKYSECTEGGLGIAIGLEMADALNIVAWVSYDGISAIPYPEATACSLFKRNIEGDYILNKKVILHAEFIKAVSQGTYPDFLLRKPENKAEKKFFLGNYKKKSSNDDTFFSTSVASFMNKQLSDDSKGAGNMYYIVNTRRNLFLSKSMTWIDIGSIKRNKKLMSQLLCVRDDITAAQTISLWITPPGEAITPHTPSTLKRKYHLTFPNVSSASFSDGIRNHKYPAFLLRRPENRREIVAFQIALRSGLKNIEERMSLGKLTDSHLNLEPVNSDKFDAVITMQDCGQEGKVLNIDNMCSGKGPLSEENKLFSFQHHVSSVMESSDLIRSIVETSVAFGRMMSDAQGLVAQRRVDLEIIQQQLLDLDHVAEFYSLNASDGYRMNRIRKEYLRKRRVIKNEIIVLDMISNYFNNVITFEEISGFVNGIKNLDRRCYTTRALTVSEVKGLIRNPETQAQILGDVTETTSPEKG